VRIEKSPIRDHSGVSAPDFVVVQDATLLQRPEVTADLKDQGMLLIDTTESALNVKVSGQAMVVTIPAVLLAKEALGQQESIFPWTGTVLLGALAAASHIIGLEALQVVARRHFRGRSGEMNALAIEKGHHHIKYTCKIP
jgi:pyruvate ferredoxin oxidoreductase gamma subunit